MCCRKKQQRQINVNINIYLYNKTKTQRLASRRKAKWHGIEGPRHSGADIGGFTEHRKIRGKEWWHGIRARYSGFLQ